ncbi:hypothetical protein [Sphingomonas immobilis]|uniref:Uncharacterized protein n=1 Tax=Sphingomonas immobilis TaxID=3063997 RepID=A0ABT8ZV45_9SPHN|nr:hypothetical protein [Sphingomonas sp. CA1-15]MDO7841448.1 hypothetical protein [Sphingomonas sp. CA1-15]
MKRIALSLGLLIAGTAQATPIDPEDARDQQRPVATVVARTNFLRGDIAGCPSAAPKCVRKGYLLSGDPVLLGKTQGGYREVSFTGPKGTLSEGFVPVAAIKPWTAPAVWTGHWVRDEGEIDIRPGKRTGTYAVDGEATYGMHDPDRVKRGGVNIGNIDGEGVPANGLLRGGDEKADYECAWSLKLAGPYLIAADNGMCGGMNVRFNGFYRRAGAPAKKR